MHLLLESWAVPVRLWVGGLGQRDWFSTAPPSLDAERTPPWMRGKPRGNQEQRGFEGLVGWRHFVKTGWATFRRARRSAGQLVSQVCTNTSVLHQVVEPGLRSCAAGFPGTQSLFLRPLRYSHVFLPISLLYGKQTLEFCVMFLGTGNGDSLSGFDVTNKSCTNILNEP